MKSATAEHHTFFARGMKMLLIAILAFAGVLFASPAMADTVGDEYENKILGNVKNEGTPLQGVKIVVEGNGYTAEVVTDADIKIAITMGCYCATPNMSTSR